MASTAHTFLFADLVGFTALAEAEGDDRALEAVLALQDRVQRVLEEHSAEQVKAIGDGLMLRCGDPSAAVKLGLRVVEELAAEGTAPPVRFGIHTGPAVSKEGDWYGRTVNVAARLCAVAPGGEVMVSEDTREAAGEIAGVEWGEREVHWLRNVSEPVATYLATPARPVETPKPTPSEGSDRAPEGSARPREAPHGAPHGPPRRRLGFLCPRNLTRERLA
jgi:adenylate cyclase